MTCYAVGYLKNIRMCPELIAYIETIDATLAPFDGRFIIHGGEKHLLEGEAAGDLIVISFPDSENARNWYRSPAYQAILPYRLENSDGLVFLIEGVDAGHRATDILPK